MKKEQQLAATLLFFLSSCHGFSYSKRKQQVGGGSGPASSSLHYTTNADNGNNINGNNNYGGDTTIFSSASSAKTTQQKQPQWVPMEIIELAAEDLQMPPSEFIQTYSDIEAYTSCDDDEDSLHECDFFGQYLGPTKWLHLTPLARECGVNRLHFEIWRDVWMNPHGSVEVADKVSKEALRYYNEFMLEEPRSSTECTTMRPLVRVKVVPASFGLEGFEDAIWEATEDVLTQSVHGEEEEMNHHDDSTTTKGKCRAVTFVVAAPDLMDPILMEGGKESPQVEFEPDNSDHLPLHWRKS